jgi:SAM-dependent methyltransferase
MTIKENLALTHLVGRGIEFGALNNPLPVDSTQAKVIFADRLTRLQALEIFPELQDIADTIVEPDMIIDFNDLASLNSIASQKFDFLIANHFIEHLVNPIQFLEGCSQILQPGGVLFLTVPNKDETFDRNRNLTTNAHLWRDYLNGETKVSGSHIRDFLNSIPAHTPPEVILDHFRENNLPVEYYEEMKLPLNPFKRRRLFNWHRQRSIHVHVWNRSSFDDFLSWINKKLEMRFSVIPSHDPEVVVGEMIYLLKKQ